MVWKKSLNVIAFHGKPISKLRSVTSHMGSHSVTCHPTQVNAPCLTGWQLDLPTPDGWMAELTLVVGYILKQFTRPQTVTHPSSNHLTVTRSGVEPTILRSRVQRPTVTVPGHPNENPLGCDRSYNRPDTLHHPTTNIKALADELVNTSQQ